MCITGWAFSCFLLTPIGVRDKIQTFWARSSMVEQWPFKPLVKGSSPFALTFNLKGLVISDQEKIFLFPVPLLS